MHARAAICLAILLWCHGRASALNPTLAVSQYAHTAWTIREGFFNSPVSSIAQTPDGYLWLGTESGLLRFDGVRIVPWQPRGDVTLPSANIMKLLVARDGRLWIGTSAGLASWKGDRLVTYPEFAGEAVPSLVEDSQSIVWAGSINFPHARLCAMRTAVECVGEDGRFGAGVFSLFAEGERLWVGAVSGLWQWTPADPRRYPSPTTSSITALMRVGDGPLLVATAGGIWHLVGDRLEPHAVPGIDRALRPVRFLSDRDRGLWIGTGAGLVHVRMGKPDLFTRSDGLSGDTVAAMFEDREGNIWVSTNEGLDRFRELAVTTLAEAGMPTALSSSILRARDGNVWIGTPDGLIRSNGGQTTVYRRNEGLPDNRIGTLFEDSAGRLLVATLGGLAVFDRGEFASLRSVATRVVYGIVEPRPGDVWIGDQEHGLIHLVGDKPADRKPWSAFGRDDPATALAFDRMRTGLWLGFYKGGLIFAQDGTTRETYGPAEGLGAGRVSQLRFEGDGALWAATAGGLSRIKDNGVATLTTANGLPCNAVHWAMPDVQHAIWLLTSCGLVRVSASELSAWIADPGRRVKTDVFDATDGIRNLATPIGFSPPAARLEDGRFWFAAPNGVAAFDPRQLPFNSRAPAVHIEQIVADRTAYDVATGAGGAVRLPPHVRELQIDYTALSLVAPQKVRFRYKLEPVDRDWQEVGNRRQAFYSGLLPREYRFRVVAANNSGVWNETGAALDFSIAPAYYQTMWFLALSIASVIAVVWGAHRVRLRVVEKHQAEITALNERLMKSQEQERIRIAGELHDGVMQDMLAATMMLGTAKRRIPADSDATATIDKVQQKLIQAGTDLRQLSHDLHPPLLQEAGLPNAVLAYCEQFSAASGIHVACDAAEDVRDLSRGAALALFRIVQEALGNAAKHASARQISVRLSRSDGMVSLIVSDDGIGLDPSRFASSGGLGLVMMRERASQLNGRFDFESAPGRGTTVRVIVPFR